MTRYIERVAGVIVATYANPQPGVTDPAPLPDDHPEIAAFQARAPDPADTPLTPDDTERLLLSLGATPAQIAAAKRNRP